MLVHSQKKSFFLNLKISPSSLALKLNVVPLSGMTIQTQLQNIYTNVPNLLMMYSVPEKLFSPESRHIRQILFILARGTIINLCKILFEVKFSYNYLSFGHCFFKKCTNAFLPSYFSTFLFQYAQIPYSIFPSAMISVIS